MISPPRIDVAHDGALHIITIPNEPSMSIVGQLLMNATLVQSGTWTTANAAVVYPFRVHRSTTVVKLGWVNGSATGGSTCVALYNATSLARLVTTTATARVTNNAVQWVDTADTTLDIGVDYYAVMSHSANTANHVTGLAAASVNLGHLLLTGIKTQGSVGTLPDPLVPTDPSATLLLPMILMATVTGAT